jgi:hypothetical protein
VFICFAQDGTYFLSVMQKESDRLHELCAKAEEHLTAELPEEGRSYMLQIVKILSFHLLKMLLQSGQCFSAKRAFWGMWAGK